MTDPNMNTSDVNIAADDAVHRHPEIEHFLNINTILHSLVDFIRPETYVSQEELQTYNEVKEKFLRESTTKRNKQQKHKPKPALEIAGVQSIRTTSGIYRFLAHHHKTNPTANNNNKPKSTTTISREELLKKLHDKMPHRQQQTENGTKRKRSNEKPKEQPKKPRPTPKEWSAATATDTQKTKSSSTPASVVPNQITFGRFEFNTEDSVDKKSKKQKGKKVPTKQKQLKDTLKKVEAEENELNRLQDENPEEGKELLRSKHWKSALAKAKGEKLRDNPQLLRKTIKKETKRRQRAAKKWQQKKSETDNRMKERQDKRQTNLQKRKDDKKAKLKKRLIKKGRLIS